METFKEICQIKDDGTIIYNSTEYNTFEELIVCLHKNKLQYEETINYLIEKNN